MMISNDGGFSGAEWVPFTSPISWTITSYGEYVIPRIVYVRYKDSQGGIHGPYTDDIIYDPIPPSGSINIGGSGDTVTLHLNASDDNSGVDKMVISNFQSFEGASWEDYAQTKQWTLDANRTVYVRYKDKAENASEVCSATQYRLYLPLMAKGHSGGSQSSNPISAFGDFVKKLLPWQK